MSNPNASSDYVLTLEALNFLNKHSENEVCLFGDKGYQEYIQVSKTLTLMGVNRNSVVAEYCPLENESF